MWTECVRIQPTIFSLNVAKNLIMDQIKSAEDKIQKNRKIWSFNFKNCLLQILHDLFLNLSSLIFFGLLKMLEAYIAHKIFSRAFQCKNNGFQDLILMQKQLTRSTSSVTSAVRSATNREYSIFPL